MADDARQATIKILGKEYRIRSDADPAHLESVADYVNRVLGEIAQTTPDTQDAAVLASLNIASDLLRSREGVAVPSQRMLALIERADSA